MEEENGQGSGSNALLDSQDEFLENLGVVSGLFIDFSLAFVKKGPKKIIESSNQDPSK